MIKAENLKLNDIYEDRVIKRGEDYLENVRFCIKVGDFLFAEVHGSSDYKTKVNLNNLEGECSCPYEFNCKHAVAAYLFYKKGRSDNADEFLAHLKDLSKEELIKLIESLVPENPKLIKKHIFRKKIDFNLYVNDFINNFSASELENIEENIDCFTFEQLLKILDYTSKNEGPINEKLSENYGSYGDSDDEGDIFYDFEYKIKDEIIKRVGSQEQLLTILKKRYMNEKIAENAEHFFKYKDIVKKYFSREEYLIFLLKCKNSDLSEIKENLCDHSEHHLFMASRENIVLVEKLAEYLDNDNLRFIVAYHKEDAKNIMQYFHCFINLRNNYLIQPEHIVDILRKSKMVTAEISKQLFTKDFFKIYSPQNIQFLANSINDKEFILKNTDFEGDFLKIKEIVKITTDLGYDARLIFNKKELIERRHWTEMVGILHFARELLGIGFVEQLIRLHKDQFVTSSTLKHNLKKEGIYIQITHGELKVEIK